MRLVNNRSLRKSVRPSPLRGYHLAPANKLFSARAEDSGVAPQVPMQASALLVGICRVAGEARRRRLRRGGNSDRSGKIYATRLDFLQMV